jgi:hypothetical protein
MALPQVEDLTAHLFALQAERLALREQAAVDAAMAGVISVAMRQLDDAAAAGPITATQAETALAPVNDRLAVVLAQQLEALQPELRPLAASYEPLGPAAAAPLQSGSQLMRQLRMAEVPLAEWLQRRSPSRWMESLISTAVQASADGWDRHRQAVERATNRAVEVMTSTALWGLMNLQLPQHWAQPQAWRYTATLENTCPICLPDHGRTSPRRTGLPQPPRHPNCMCLILPLATDQ